MNRNTVKYQYFAYLYGKRVDKRRVKRIKRIMLRNLAKYGTYWGPKL